MKRRSFFKMVGGAGASAFLWSKASWSKNTIGASDRDSILLNKEWLQNRNQNRSTVVSQNGMVCTSQPLASLAGIDILKAGGNAIDAAVCANAMLSLVEPMSCGPGGDLFAIVWIEKEKKLYGLNASGRSPYDWDINAATSLGLNEIPVYGPLSWSVPGCVSGWKALLDKFGRKNMAQVLDTPTVYAKDGFPVSPIIARSWASIKSKEYPTLIRPYVPEGTPPLYGDIFKNPDLAEFFDIISRDPDEFYKGEIADRIVRFSKANNGRLSKRDFRDHTIDWIEPVSSNYRGYDVWELPPNGQGIAALQILNLLEHFDISSLEPNSAEQLHLFIEAKKLAFEDRAVYYADMDFADVPLKQLISKDYAKERVKLLNPYRAAQKVAAGRIPGFSDTVYLTAADKDGNMISLIQSIYFGFGSQMVPDNLGFTLQNRGHLFSLNPKDRNKLEPHKRPFHTIIPAFVTKAGNPLFSFGVMGGDFQPQGHAQVLMNLIDFDMSPQQAGEQPRIQHNESSTPVGEKMVGAGTVQCERYIPDTVKSRLEAMGHKLNPNVGAFGGYQGIWRKESPRRYLGGSDPRKDGCAIGY